MGSKNALPIMIQIKEKSYVDIISRLMESMDMRMEDLEGSWKRLQKLKRVRELKILDQTKRLQKLKRAENSKKEANKKILTKIFKEGVAKGQEMSNKNKKLAEIRAQVNKMRAVFSYLK